MIKYKNIKRLIEAHDQIGGVMLVAKRDSEGALYAWLAELEGSLYSDLSEIIEAEQEVDSVDEALRMLDDACKRYA